MYLRFIDSGTKLNITIIETDNVSAKDYEGTFYELESSASFSMKCNELFDIFSSIERNKQITINFQANKQFYTFRGTIIGTETRRRVNLVIVKATTLIEAATRRAYPRHEFEFPVKLYELDSNAAGRRGALICEGISVNISAAGICFKTSANIDFAFLRAKKLIAEFSIKGIDSFLIKCSFVRYIEKNLKYGKQCEYAFKFNFEGKGEDKNRLVTAMFNYKFRS